MCHNVRPLQCIAWVFYCQLSRSRLRLIIVFGTKNIQERRNNDTHVNTLQSIYHGEPLPPPNQRSSSLLPLTNDPHPLHEPGDTTGKAIV